MSTHPLDQALALQADPDDADLSRGTTHPSYWNMVGPFGGTTAAVLTRAVMNHPKRLGTPVALTVNYAAALGQGPFEVRATPVRTNRSTQHWTLSIAQADDAGEPQINTTATLFSALRRDTWSDAETPAPQVARPQDIERLTIGPSRVEWVNQYDMRPVRGAIPAEWNGAQGPSETLMWVRDAQERALDYPSLAALCDIFFPRVWLRRATMVPAGTVSITSYFHVDEAQLAGIGTGYLLGRAVGQRFANGYFDQTAQLWDEAGHLIATTHQIVYFKE